VVLLFHGGSGHKRNERNSRMGRWLAASAGIAAIAIDGPHHGDRVSAPMSPAVYQQLIADEGIEHVTARMTKDWLDAVSAIAVQGFVDDAKVSVFGMSMGARFGVPVAAALGSRVRCGVFGKFGLRQTEALHPGLCAPGLMVTAARAVSALASPDKRLFARSGAHAETHPDDEASWLEFLRRETTDVPGVDMGNVLDRCPGGL
jgi:dienelactone hydrolase